MLSVAAVGDDLHPPMPSGPSSATALRGPLLDQRSLALKPSLPAATRDVPLSWKCASACSCGRRSGQGADVARQAAAGGSVTAASELSPGSASTRRPTAGAAAHRAGGHRYERRLQRLGIRLARQRRGPDVARLRLRRSPRAPRPSGRRSPRRGRSIGPLEGARSRPSYRRERKRTQPRLSSAAGLSGVTVSARRIRVSACGSSIE